MRAPRRKRPRPQWEGAPREGSRAQAAGQGEAQLGVYHGQTRADELVELRAAGLGAGLQTLVVDDRPGRIATDEFGAAEELLEQVGVPPVAAQEQPPQSEGERPREEVAPPVDQARGELPGAEAGRRLEPPARARER